MMTNSFHYLLPTALPTFALYLAAAAGLYIWARLYGIGYARGRHPALPGIAVRILTGFVALTLVAQALQRHLIFAISWPLWPIMLAGAVAVEVIVFLYQPERDDSLMPRRAGLLLTVLRTLLILALIFMLCQPVRSWERINTTHRKVAVLVDISPSMGVPDNNATPAEKIRLAHLLALPGAPRPCLLVEKAVRLKDIQQKLQEKLRNPRAPE